MLAIAPPGRDAGRLIVSRARAQAMSRTRYVIGNWKMNGTRQGAALLARAVAAGGVKGAARARAHLLTPSLPLPSPRSVEIFGSALGLFGVIVAIIQSNSSEFP